MRHSLLLSLTLLLLVAAGGCGSNGTSVPPVNGDELLDAAWPESWTGLPTDADGARTASALFNWYMIDMVNEHSEPRWVKTNDGGMKLWKLVNQFNSLPKSWQLGGNYWGGERDALTSHLFSVPVGRRGIKLGFMSRWDIAPGDHAFVEYRLNAADPWVQLADFTAGQSAAFPSWQRYTFGLPDTMEEGYEMEVRFRFTSNYQVNAWGWGLDDIAVYQTLIPQPLNLDADPESPQDIPMVWDHNFDGQRPLFYDIYRSDDGENGEYFLLDSVPYPQRNYVDTTGAPFTEYWYKICGRREGWDDGPFSEADFGGWFQFD
jgi:hypothetical protein